MANLLGGFFKRIEKPQDTHPPSALNEFSQYDSEYITYWTACAFYAADWTGIIEVDMELGVTNTGWWHNPDPQIKKLQRISEFENFFPMQTWQKAIKEVQPVIILDVNEVAKTSPQEYQTYTRLGVRTMIAVPFGPKPLGFLVLRNPARYNTLTSAARGFAYIVHRALAQKRTIDRVKMALTPEEIKSDKDIVINFFGDMEIITQDGVWKEHDFTLINTLTYYQVQWKYIDDEVISNEIPVIDFTDNFTYIYNGNFFLRQPNFVKYYILKHSSLMKAEIFRKASL